LNIYIKRKSLVSRSSQQFSPKEKIKFFTTEEEEAESKTKKKNSYPHNCVTAVFLVDKFL
jgi:hypothetical protein